MNLDDVEMAEVREHYLRREQFHHRLRTRFEEEQVCHTGPRHFQGPVAAFAPLQISWDHG